MAERGWQDAEVGEVWAFIGKPSGEPYPYARYSAGWRDVVSGITYQGGEENPLGNMSQGTPYRIWPVETKEEGK